MPTQMKRCNRVPSRAPPVLSAYCLNNLLELHISQDQILTGLKATIKGTSWIRGQMEGGELGKGKGGERVERKDCKTKSSLKKRSRDKARYFLLGCKQTASLRAEISDNIWQHQWKMSTLASPVTAN